MRGTPGSAFPQPEPNATELPSSAPGRPGLIKLQASAPSPTPTRAEEHIATTPDCRPRAQAPSPTPTRAEHLSGLQIARLRALAHRRAPKRTPHYTCWCERGTLHVERLGCFNMGARNRDAAVAASWQQHHSSLSAPRRSAGTAAAARSCGVAAATAAMRGAVVTMRSVFLGAAALARACNLAYRVKSCIRRGLPEPQTGRAWRRA